MTIRYKPRKPRITVGGRVGRTGGDIVRTTTRVIERHLKAPLSAPKRVKEVVEGKPLKEAIRDEIKAQIEPWAETAELAAKVESTAEAIIDRLAGTIGGEDAQDFVADLRRVLQPYPLEIAAGVLRGIQLYIETGKLSALNPVALLIAGEIANARNVLWDAGKPIPSDVVAAMPEELRGRAGVCRYTESDKVPGNTKLPKIAIKHLKNASAVCLIDLIVFKNVPGSSSEPEKFIWSHELYHAVQYAQWGLQGFIAKYVENEINYPHKENKIEVDADYYACDCFPRGEPKYISACPLPSASPPAPPRKKAQGGESRGGPGNR